MRGGPRRSKGVPGVGFGRKSQENRAEVLQPDCLQVSQVLLFAFIFEDVVSCGTDSKTDGWRGGPSKGSIGEGEGGTSKKVGGDAPDLFWMAPKPPEPPRATK